MAEREEVDSVPGIEPLQEKEEGGDCGKGGGEDCKASEGKTADNERDGKRSAGKTDEEEDTRAKKLKTIVVEEKDHQGEASDSDQDSSDDDDDDDNEPGADEKSSTDEEDEEDDSSEESTDVEGDADVEEDKAMDLSPVVRKKCKPKRGRPRKSTEAAKKKKKTPRTKIVIKKKSAPKRSPRPRGRPPAKKTPRAKSVSNKVSKRVSNKSGPKKQGTSARSVIKRKLAQGFKAISDKVKSWPKWSWPASKMNKYPGMSYGSEAKYKRLGPKAEYRNTKVKAIV